MAESESRRRRGPSPQKTAETQAKIVDAAVARFLSLGFERTRMLDVARDAGLAKGTLYLYYPTKEALFEGVVTLMLGGAVQRLTVEPPAEKESTRDFVRRALLPLVTDERAAMRQSLMWLILTEGQRFPEVLAAYRKVALDPVLAAARRISARARHRGELWTDALERFPMLLLAPGVLVSVWNHMFSHEAIEPADVFEGYIDLLFPAWGNSPPKV
jgi:AcrR family transcriptional regulator